MILWTRNLRADSALLCSVPLQWVVSDKTLCKPYDEVKMNQWVRALTL